MIQVFANVFLASFIFLGFCNVMLEV